MRTMVGYRAASVLLVAGVVAVLGASTVHAQVASPLQFTTDFTFLAGSTRFPAGTYSFTAVPGDSEVYEVSNGHTSAFVEMMPGAVHKPAQTSMSDEVMFNKYGDSTFVLGQVWDATDQAGVSAVTSRLERRYAEQFGTPTTRTVSSHRG